MSAPGRRAAAGMIVALVLALTAGAAAAVDPVRTMTGLGGYRINATGAPLQILLDDPTIPLPRPPEAAVLEADPSFTQTTLSTGPQGRALASALWPGTLIGNGLPNLSEGAPDYPIKAEASFPGGAALASAEPGMDASAQGLDVVATASGATPPQVEQSPLRSGTTASRSASTVIDDIGIASVIAEASDVDLMGLVQVRSVRTTVLSRSDGRLGSTEGTTVVSGLTVNGQGYTVDDRGVRPVQGDQRGGSVLPALPAAPQGLADAGITVDPVVHSEQLSGATASRVATGLRISIDTAALRAALGDPQFGDSLGQVCGAVPAEGLPPPLPSAQGNCFYLLSATPKITLVLAAGSVSAAANLPRSLPVPAVPLPPLPPGRVAAGPVPSRATAALEVLSAPPVLGGPPAPGQPPLVAPPTAVALSEPPSIAAVFAGIFVGLVLASAAAAGLAGRGLLALQAVAFLGGAGPGTRCSLGAPKDIPDLRGESA
ncbi:MAG: hypothetical protein M4D85_02540 [Actinomycetota bacterium]|nr:hypothetical protein [Actinomycetota bacterium]